MPIPLIDIYFLIALLVAGLAVGFGAGLFGIGGGTVLIPVFLTIFPYFSSDPSIVMHVAIATSLALIIPTSISSTMAHSRLGNFDVAVFKRWIPGVIIGVLLGTTLIHYIPSFWLKIFFTTYLFFCFTYALFKKQPQGTKGNGPTGLARGFLSFMVGLFSSLLGIGGGTFTVPIFMFFDYPLKKAIAISATTGLFIGVVGAVCVTAGSLGVTGTPKYSLGYVNILAFLVVTPTAMLASPWGAKLASKLEHKTLQKVYAGFLLFIFLFMIFKLVTHFEG